jgi:hypothetical protein
LAETFGARENSRPPDFLESLHPQGEIGLEELTQHLSNRLESVWSCSDHLRNHSRWGLILEALLPLSPERVFAQVSPSEFAAQVGRFDSVLNGYFADILDSEKGARGEWAHGMTVGWMLLVLDAMTHKLPWSKTTLSAFRNAFQTLPLEVLPEKIRLGLSLASENWSI